MLEALIVAAILVVLGSVFLVPAAKDRPRDSTDAPDGPRSGMVIRVDALTGCQYVESGRGGLAPRLGPDGRPLCGAGVPR